MLNNNPLRVYTPFPFICQGTLGLLPVFATVNNAATNGDHRGDSGVLWITSFKKFLMGSNLCFFFSFVAYTLGVVSKKLLPIPRSQGSLLVFSSTSWMALVLTFRCLTFWVKPYSCFVDWWLSACPPVVRSASVTLRGWRLKACGREPFTPVLPPPPPPWTLSRPLLAPEEWELWSKDSGS